jgi:gamma-glutamyltranspeptidase
MHGVQPPASGAIFAYVLNILKFYNFEEKDMTPLLYHRVTEAFKWAYAQRTKLADPSDEDITYIIKDVSSGKKTYLIYILLKKIKMKMFVDQ